MQNVLGVIVLMPCLIIQWVYVNVYKAHLICYTHVTTVNCCYIEYASRVLKRIKLLGAYC